MFENAARPIIAIPHPTALYISKFIITHRKKVNEINHKITCLLYIHISTIDVKKLYERLFFTEYPVTNNG